MADEADKDYEIAQAKKDSEKLEDLTEARDKMMQERFQAQGKRYLQELRKSAMIEYR